MIQVLFLVLIWFLCVSVTEVKTEFEQKITELNRAGDSKAALGEWSYSAALVILLAPVQCIIHIIAEISPAYFLTWQFVWGV